MVDNKIILLGIAGAVGFLLFTGKVKAENILGTGTDPSQSGAVMSSLGNVPLVNGGSSGDESGTTVYNFNVDAPDFSGLITPVSGSTDTKKSSATGGAFTSNANFQPAGNGSFTPAPIYVAPPKSQVQVPTKKEQNFTPAPPAPYTPFPAQQPIGGYIPPPSWSNFFNIR